MADVAKIYGVGDNVFVFVDGNDTPQARVVSKVQILTDTNEARVEFTAGNPVNDGAVQRVFETQALCATAIIDAAIARLNPTVVLEGGGDTQLIRAA